MRLSSVCVLSGLFMAVSIAVHGQGAQPRFVDLSHEQAFAPKGGTPILESLLSMHVVANNEVLIASDLYRLCDNEKDKNVYTILVVNPTTGSVVSRRTFSARPESHEVIVDANGRPVLISDRSLQVLDLQSLATIQSINFYEPDANATANEDEAGAENICGYKPFSVSVTPDSHRIQVAIPHHAQKTTDLVSIDGETLEFVRKQIPGFTPEFRVGFGGVYERKHWRSWYWRDDAGEHQVCDVCDYLNVLSQRSIVLGTNNGLSVQTDGKGVWDAHFSGMRDNEFDASLNGDTFVILAATRSGLFRGAISLTPIVFNVARRSSKRLPNIVTKQTGDIEGGLRSAIAISSNGLEVAVFLEGRIAIYNLHG